MKRQRTIEATNELLYKMLRAQRSTTKDLRYEGQGKNEIKEDDAMDLQEVIAIEKDTCIIIVALR